MFLQNHKKNLLMNKTWGILRTPLLKENVEKKKFLVLSPSNLFQTILINKAEQNEKVENIFSHICLDEKVESEG